MKAPKPIRNSRITIIRAPSRKLILHHQGSEINAEDIKDSIIWAKPSSDATPETVAKLLAKLRELGAARVVALPLEAMNAAIPSSFQTAASLEQGAREVVAEMLEEVKEQKELVCEIVEAALNDAGL